MRNSVRIWDENEKTQSTLEHAESSKTVQCISLVQLAAVELKFSYDE